MLILRPISEQTKETCGDLKGETYSKMGRAQKMFLMRFIQNNYAPDFFNQGQGSSKTKEEAIEYELKKLLEKKNTKLN